MQFKVNGTEYIADETRGGFVWSNDRYEESAAFHATPLESQQDALDWESGRAARYEGTEEEATDARNRHLNQRSDDARGA
jgi:hypothetical protein